MIDFADVVALRIRSMGYKDARVRRLADISKGGIAVRRVPSAVTSTFYDRSRTIAAIVQVVVARESEKQAIEECEDIALTITGLDLESRNGSYRLVSAENYTMPQELESTAGMSVWETRIRAEIII